MSAVAEKPGSRRRLERCPACSETLQDRGDISVCINCATGYSDEPEIRKPARATQPDLVPQGDQSNVVSLKGCRQCGSAYEGNGCHCGAVYNEPPPLDYVATAEKPQPIASHADRVCRECRVPRDLIGTRLVCPLCEDARPLPNKTPTFRAAEADLPRGGSESSAAEVPPSPASTPEQPKQHQGRHARRR